MLSILIFAQLNKRDMRSFGGYMTEPKLSLTCKNETGMEGLRYIGRLI